MAIGPKSSLKRFNGSIMADSKRKGPTTIAQLIEYMKWHTDAFKYKKQNELDQYQLAKWAIFRALQIEIENTITLINVPGIDIKSQLEARLKAIESDEKDLVLSVYQNDYIPDWK